MNKLISASILLFAIAGCSGNISESRGEPDRGQVSNSGWSVADVTVYPSKGSYTIKPGGSSKKGQKILKLCIPAGYSGSLVRQSDENPAGFPPETVNGGGCTKVDSDDVISVTVKK